MDLDSICVDGTFVPYSFVDLFCRKLFPDCGGEEKDLEFNRILLHFTVCIDFPFFLIDLIRPPGGSLDFHFSWNLTSLRNSDICAAGG